MFIRYSHRKYINYVKLVCFPKPYKQWKIRRYNAIREKVQNEKCKRWINACGQPASGPNAFTIKILQKKTYMYQTFCNITLCNVDCNMYSPKKNANSFATSTTVVKPSRGSTNVCMPSYKKKQRLS